MRLLFICDKTQFNDALQVSQRLLEPFHGCFQKIRSSERLAKIFWVRIPSDTAAIIRLMMDNFPVS